MYVKRFKTSITVTIFCFLMFGMALTNAVGLVLYYQYILHGKIDEVKTQLSWLGEDPILKAGQNRLYKQTIFDAIKKVIGKDCLEVAIKYQDRSEDYYVHKNNYLMKIVDQVAKTQEEQVSYMEGDLFPFLLIPSKIIVAVPILNQDTKQQLYGSIGIILSNRQLLLDLWDKQKIIAAYIVINSIILTTLAYFRMRDVLFDPVSRLVEIAESYRVTEGQGFFSQAEANEFGQLSRVMNSMITRIENDRAKLFDYVDTLERTNASLQSAQNEVIRAEKLAAAGRLFAGLAHEVGNPVAIVQGYLELLEHEDIDLEDRRQFVRRGIQELHRIDNLLNQLLDATRVDEGLIEKVDLNRLVSSLLEILEISFAKKQIRMHMELSEKPLYVKGNREKFHQVLLNMVINALDAVAEKYNKPFEAEIGIFVKEGKGQDNQNAVIEISDNGIGIPQENIDVIFEPFYTTKAVGKGTGLGLAVSYRIIQSYGGRIDVARDENKNTVFSIILPKIMDNER